MNHADEPTQALPPVEGEPTPVEGSTAAPVEEAAAGPSPLTWVLSGLLVFALVAGIAWFAFTTSRANREASMRSAASDYLTAVAEGDAEAALGLLAERPENTTLLTHEVLAVAHEAAPLTEIEAGTLGGTETAPTVEVTYKLGDEPVTTTIPLAADGRDWKVADGTVDLAVPERRALTVNGAQLTEEVNPVFPGTYTAEPVSDKVGLTGEPAVVVSAPDQADESIDVTLGLSELGSQTVLDAVKGRFDECLAATESRPVGCPFGVGVDGVEVQEGSVKFALVNDPWAGFAPTLDPETLVASGTFSYDMTATATVSREGLSTQATIPLKADRGYAVDLSKNPAVVTWS